MDIKTKFDVGQEVWIIRRDEAVCEHCGSIRKSDWFVSHNDVVTGVQATRTNYRFSHTEYELLASLNETEVDIFPTEADAQAECNRRNKEAGSG